MEDIKYLREQLEIEKQEKKEIQDTLFRALRLNAPMQQIQQEMSGGNNVSLRGAISPSRQRFNKESESRRRYWEEKAREAKPLTEVGSRTEG